MHNKRVNWSPLSHICLLSEVPAIDREFNELQICGNELDMIKTFTLADHAWTIFFRIQLFPRITVLADASFNSTHNKNNIMFGFTKYVIAFSGQFRVYLRDLRQGFLNSGDENASVAGSLYHSLL